MSEKALFLPKCCPDGEIHFGKIPVWSLIYFLNYVYFDLPSPDNYGTPFSYSLGEVIRILPGWSGAGIECMVYGDLLKLTIN